MNSSSEIDYEPVFNGLRFANQGGYSLIFSDSYQGSEFEKLLDRIDGLIILSSHSKEKQRIRQLINREIPLVLVESYLSDARANCIRVDNVEGGYIATRHLLGLGHTRIVHITGDLNYHFRYLADVCPNMIKYKLEVVYSNLSISQTISISVV